ncbi:ABC transporter ATP-binding protein [Spiroplasma culicicola]|uniref:ABC transporter ATP-binding protein n=1 Tax=Spiroplasma culicicola AES-1 TaxID=1276246 RepID=W6A6P5_9MOLU|nr:ABC transporter ATP-binding protein [Spiroplasma culicicola]AHI52545.1 ABC transporter ATP-binding protein [Spiroplasma culicicola AES-1]
MIEIKELTKDFRNKKGIFNISINIETNEIVGIVGDNGAGKSTLIKTIFEEYSKDSGHIIYNGDSLNREIIKKFEFFPDQSIYPKNIKIYDFAYYSALLSGLRENEIKINLEQLFEALDLVDYKQKTFNDLSAGMQKRALLIICLVSNPKIIFMDEPTANLDVNSRMEFMELIKFLKKWNKTVIITSHIIDELQTVIDKLVIIEEGFLKYCSKFDNKVEKIKDIYSKHSTKKAKLKIDKVDFLNER